MKINSWVSSAVAIVSIVLATLSFMRVQQLERELGWDGKKMSGVGELVVNRVVVRDPDEAPVITIGKIGEGLQTEAFGLVVASPAGGQQVIVSNSSASLGTIDGRRSVVSTLTPLGYEAVGPDGTVTVTHAGMIAQDKTQVWSTKLTGRSIALRSAAFKFDPVNIWISEGGAGFIHCTDPSTGAVAELNSNVLGFSSRDRPDDFRSAFGLGNGGDGLMFLSTANGNREISASAGGQYGGIFVLEDARQRFEPLVISPLGMSEPKPIESE